MPNVMKMVMAASTTVISHAAALNSAAWTYSGLTGLTMTELDNSTNLYPYAKAVLSVPDTFAAAPSAGTSVNLYMCRNDVDGTSDTTPPPDATALKNAVFVGAFPISAYDVAQTIEINISLDGVKKADFFIQNSCGQALSYTSNPITVKVTPFSYAPA